MALKVPDVGDGEGGVSVGEVAEGVSWLFTSTDGTVDVVTNATTGATTQSYRDPFGAPLPGTGQAWGDGTGYLNKPVSTSIKLTTIGARVYDAVLGKFLSVDPVIDPDTPQQNIGYAYSDNNPTTYTDPAGLRFAFDHMADNGSTKPIQKIKYPWTFKKKPAARWNPNFVVDNPLFAPKSERHTRPKVKPSAEAQVRPAKKEYDELVQISQAANGISLATGLVSTALDVAAITTVPAPRSRSGCTSLPSCLGQLA